MAHWSYIAWIRKLTVYKNLNKCTNLWSGWVHKVNQVRKWMKVTSEQVSEFSRSAASKLRNMFAPMDIKQYSLDLIFTKLAVDVAEAIDPLIKCDEHHIPAVFTFEANTVETVNFDRIVYNF